MSAVAVLTTGASPSTVIVSETPPTSSATSTFTVSLTFSTMPLRVTVLKPESVTSTTVVADRQELEPVGAHLVGGHGAVEAGVDVPRGDGDAGQGAAARVGDGADDGGGGDLRAGGRRQRERQQDGEAAG